MVYDAFNPEVSVQTPVVWVGADIVLRSGQFTGPDTLPIVILGTDTLAARYAAPDTLHVVAPDHPGNFQLYVGFRGRPPLPFGAVEVGGGYSGDRSLARIGGYPLPWPGGGLPQFLIALPQGLAAVDPRVWTVRQVLPDSVFSQYCVNGPGPAPGGRIVVAGRTATGGCGPLVALRLDTPGLAPDTLPGERIGYRFAAELGPGRWLLTSHHRVSSWSRDSTGAWTTTEYSLGESYDLVISPRGDWAVPIGAYSYPAGTPVFSASAAGPAYVLSDFSEIWGAQFSDDGDTLLVVATPTDTTGNGGAVLAALRASDGTVIRSVRALGGANGLVLDPGRPWLYLIGYSPGLSGPAVQVYERATFTPITVLHVPSPGYASPLYATLYAAGRKLYLLDTCPWCVAGYSLGVTVFDLLP
jgi:hypothetical protein